jgi:ABC-2 type transport system ATP-binding protein
MEALIQIQNLSHDYGDLRAVNNISFDLLPGEVLGFLGPNGAGKSTTMQMISGGLPASSGSILLAGIDLIKDPIRAKQQLGYLPENPPLYPEMTVDEYLTYCARLHHIPSRQAGQTIDQAKQRCGLQQQGKRLIANLSKGYKQRVGIAQAILHRPKVIILDEPTNGLDPNQIQQIRALIRELAQECGVLLSTHILPEVQAICDRVQILHQGELVYADHIDRLSGLLGNRLRVRLEQPPEPERLNQLDGILQTEQLAAGEYQLTLEAQASPAHIAQQLVETGWGLLQLQPEQDALEQAFTRLTTGAAAQ